MVALLWTTHRQLNDGKNCMNNIAKGTPQDLVQENLGYPVIQNAKSLLTKASGFCSL